MSSHDPLNFKMRLRAQTVNTTFKKWALIFRFATLRSWLKKYCTDIANRLNSTLLYPPLLTNCDTCGLLYITGGAEC